MQQSSNLRQPTLKAARERRLGEGERSPMVTLLPMVVGSTLPLMLVLATCTMLPSWMLVMAPTLMLFTSPGVRRSNEWLA